MYSTATVDSYKEIFEIDISKATNIANTANLTKIPAGKTLDRLTAAKPLGYDPGSPNQKGRANIKFTSSSDAHSNNYGGLYRIDDINGTVNGLKPEDKGYAEAALNGSLDILNGSPAILGKMTKLLVNRSCFLPLYPLPLNLSPFQ